MCTDEKATVQHEPEQMQAPQGFGEAPESVPENHEENMYASKEAAPGYAVGGQQMPQAPEGYVYMQAQPQMPPQPEMYQAPQMPQAPQGQPMYQMPPMPPHPQMMQSPQMYQAPQMPQAPQGQPMYQMPPMPPHPQMMQAPQMPFMGQPQQGGAKAGGCSHDHKQEDPFGGMFGMFGEMVDNNPNLSALNKVVGATNSDFLKGAMLGAGLTLLLTSDGVKEMLAGLFAGTMDMFDKDEDTGEEDE